MYTLIFSFSFLHSGAAKRLIKTWKAKGYLTPDNLKTIQRIVDSAEVPSDVAKLLGIIDNFSFDGFTADEIKIFFLMFATFLYLTSFHSTTFSVYGNSLLLALTFVTVF